MVWEIPWETETVLDLVTQEPGRKLLELRQDLEEIRKRIASPVVQRLAAADYNLDSIYASLEGNAAGKLFQAANHYQQLVSKLIDQAQSNLAVADTHLDNMLMRIDEAAEQARVTTQPFDAGPPGTCQGLGGPRGPFVTLREAENEKARLEEQCLNVGGQPNIQVDSFVYDSPTQGPVTMYNVSGMCCFPSDSGGGGSGPPIQPPPPGQPPSSECVFQDLGPYPTQDAAERKLTDLRNSCPPNMVFEGHVSPRQIQREDGGFETFYYVSYRCCPATTTTTNGTTTTTTNQPPTVTCPAPQVTCPAPQVSCPTPTIQVVLQCPAGGPPIWTGPMPTPTPIGPPIGPPGSGGPPIGIGPSGTGGPPINIPPFPVPPFGGPSTGFGPPGGPRVGTGGPQIEVPPFPVPPFGGSPSGFGPPSGNGTGETPTETTTTTTTGGPPTTTTTTNGACILPVLQPGSIVRYYEQGNNFDDMKLKGDSIVAGAKTAKPEGQFSYMICQCEQTFILIVFEVVTADARKCEVLVAESGEKPKAEFEVTSLPRRDEDQPCWDIYPVGGDMFRLAWEYFRNRQQAASILNQLKLEAP
jgi:hypothetical protein